ncbi:MAG: hypothetical protein AAGG01_24605 [Planctomycetota bacterium]
MTRLFFGLSVDPVVGQSLLRGAKRALSGAPEGGIDLYEEEDLHVTLCFLGSFPPDRIAALREAANYEFKGLFAPELLVGEEGDSLPSRVEPRALVTGVEETAETVGRLAAVRNRTWQVALSQGWRGSRSDRERPFQPHVTLARASDVPARELEDFWDLSAERRWLPLDIVLYESLDAEAREAAGVRYRTLAAWPLSVRPG